MAAMPAPPRFVPTLTDVVSTPAMPGVQTPEKPAPGQSAAPQAGAAASNLKLPPAPVPVPAPAQTAITPELVAQIADRVQAVLQERMALALQSALREMRPLVHDAVIQALKKPQD